MTAQALKFKPVSQKTATPNRGFERVEPVTERSFCPVVVTRRKPKYYGTLSGKHRHEDGTKGLYYYCKNGRKWNKWWQVAEGKKNYFGWYGLKDTFQMQEFEKGKLTLYQETRIIVSDTPLEIEGYRLFAIAEHNGKYVELSIIETEKSKGGHNSAAREDSEIELLIEHVREHFNEQPHHTREHTAGNEGSVWDSHVMPHLRAGNDHDPFHVYRVHSGHSHHSEEVNGHREHREYGQHEDAEQGEHHEHGHYKHGNDGHGQHEDGYLLHHEEHTGGHNGSVWDSHVMPHLRAGNDHDPFHVYRVHFGHSQHIEEVNGHREHGEHGHHEDAEQGEHPEGHREHEYRHSHSEQSEHPAHDYHHLGHHHSHHERGYNSHHDIEYGTHNHESNEGEHDHIWSGMLHMLAGRMHDVLHMFRGGNHGEVNEHHDRGHDHAVSISHHHNHTHDAEHPHEPALHLIRRDSHPETANNGEHGKQETESPHLPRLHLIHGELQNEPNYDKGNHYDSELKAKIAAAREEEQRMPRLLVVNDAYPPQE